MFDMRRRHFIMVLGGAAAWPLATWAQQPAMPVVGYLSSVSPEPEIVAAFRRGLGESGFVEGQNVAIDYRWAEGRYDRLSAWATDLARRQVAVIVGDPPMIAAKAATETIPIVFNTATDPMKLGLVTSLNRPVGNVTGVSTFSSQLGAKRLELLQELVPQASVIAVLTNPIYPTTESQVKEVQEAAAHLGMQPVVLAVSTEPDMDAAFATLAQKRAGGLVVGVDAFLFSHRNQIAALAARYRMPAVYAWREFAAAGGLMSYGISRTDAYRQVGVYTGRILKGAKPADLPVMQPTKFELVINLKTAKALGLQIPDKLLALADEVIE
jgi:putative tryptophan/tyrosine transport system substrate-binding protein